MLIWLDHALSDQLVGVFDLFHAGVIGIHAAAVDGAGFDEMHGLEFAVWVPGERGVVHHLDQLSERGDGTLPDFANRVILVLEWTGPNPT